MKIVKLFLALALVCFSHLALADNFILTINNNTDDGFNLSSTPAPRSLGRLNPDEQNQPFTLVFMPWARKFVLLLSSDNGQKASVIYEDPTIFCNPQTTYYRCSFSKLTTHSATLTLSKMRP